MSTKYSVIRHIRYEIVSDEGKRVFVIPNATGAPDMKNVLCLSDVSLEIWNMICDGLTKSEVIHTLCEKYPQDKLEISKDVGEFLSNLWQKNYIEISESDS